MSGESTDPIRLVNGTEERFPGLPASLPRDQGARTVRRKETGPFTATAEGSRGGQPDCPGQWCEDRANEREGKKVSTNKPSHQCHLSFLPMEEAS